MTRYDRLLTRARAGEPILIDGATGSEAVRRGVPETDHGWSGMSAVTHPGIVRSIHDEYVALGARMIASCTFATGKNVCRDVGAPERFEELNRRAVEIAVEARDAHGDDDVVVAAGISNWSFARKPQPLDELRDETIEQATIMRDAGADLFSLEMMCDIPRMTATLDAVTEVGLPVWVGFTVGREEGLDAEDLPDPIPLRSEERVDGGEDLLIDAVDVAAGYGVDAMFVMHTDTRLVEACLEAIRPRWDGVLGAYAHATAVVDGVLTFEDAITPQDYASFVPAWRSAGATVIGGCCGIGPAHMHAVVEGGLGTAR
ncbi:MAG: homocysteine S-methyltransferase family protein [Actinomycetota bacterium]